MSKPDEIYVGAIEGTDQLDPNESLAGEIGDDPLEAGYSPPDHEPVATRWGNTLNEVLQGEPLDMRLAEEEPEISDEDLDEVDEQERAGRLVAIGEDDSEERREATAEDVGRAGWASSAEEAAMHIVEE